MLVLRCTDQDFTIANNSKYQNAANWPIPCITELNTYTFIPNIGPYFPIIQHNYVP
jgi:hypothetical protein